VLAAVQKPIAADALFSQAAFGPPLLAVAPLVVSDYH
jgi:hypothetical protein